MLPSSRIRLICDDLFLDFDHECLLFEGKAVPLGIREFPVLSFLCENKPYYVSRQKILRAVWGDTTNSVEDSNVDHVIGSLRGILRDLRVAHRIQIEAKRPYGFRLVCSVEESDEAEAQPLPRPQGRFGHAVLSDTHLIGLGLQGDELWSHRFQNMLRHPSQDELEWRVQYANFDAGNGIATLVAARFRQPGPPDTIYCFGADGTPLWSWEALPPLRDRGGRRFERAWRITHMMVTPSTGGDNVWVALANDAGWAGCVMRVDAHGSASLRFANTGFVERLGFVRTPAAGDAVIACGETNAFENAFVAMLRVDDLPCCSPVAHSQDEGFPRYRYADAPKASPAKYIRFPNTELVRARSRPYGHTRGLQQFPERIIVEVETGEESFFRYHFSELLEPQFVFPSGTHEFAHRDLEGLLGHPWESCPERAHPLTLKILESGTRWRDEPILWRDDPWTEE